MSGQRTIADVYSASGHLGATVHQGVVTVTVRNAIGEHSSITMNLASWVDMIEHSRARVAVAVHE